MKVWIGSAVIGALFTAVLYWFLPGMHWGIYLIAFLIATSTVSQHL
jgi:hypothetical protein